MFKYIDHIALHVKNRDDVVNFYCKIFGFYVHYESIIPSGDKIIYLKLGDTILEINDKYQGEITGSHFCIRTDSFDSDYQRLIDNGLKICQLVHNTNPRTPEEIGWKRAVFKGLGGEYIEIRG